MTAPGLDAPAAYVTSAVEQFTGWGDRTALVHDERSMTFRQLLSLTHRMARVFGDHGLGRGDGLVLLAANPLEMTAVGLAAHILGIRYTPVYAGGGDRTARHILSDAAPGAVVLADAGATMSAERMAEAARAAGVRVLFSLGPGPDPEVTDLLAAAGERPDDPVPVAARQGDVARVLYTGGTTGLPKGVVYTFGALSAAAGAWAGDAPPPGLRFLAMSPMAHAAGAVAFGLLRHGVTVELFDTFDAGVLLRRVAEASGAGHLVTTYLYPPYLYRVLDHPDLPATDLSGLAAVSYGSAPMAADRLAEAVRRLGPRLRQSYASTEAIAITGLGPADHALAAAARPELFTSVGRAVPGVTVRVTGPDGRPQAPGTEGAIEVSGPTVMAGYWQQPDRTARVLRDGWLRTGDLGRLDEDGYLYLTGRETDVVIVDGTNCHPRAVESVLSSHPAVRQAVVLGVPDARTGEALLAVCAAAPEAAAGLTAELRALVHDALGPAHVPGRFEFVADIPTASYGKPDKAALSALFTPTSPTSSRSDG